MTSGLPIVGFPGSQARAAEQRLAPRRALYLWAMSRRYGSTKRLRVIVKNLSRTGFRVSSSADYALDDLIFIEFERGVEIEARVVRQDGSRPDYGCKFRTALTQADVDCIAARSIYGEFLREAA